MAVALFDVDEDKIVSAGNRRAAREELVDHRWQAAYIIEIKKNRGRW